MTLTYPAKYFRCIDRKTLKSLLDAAWMSQRFLADDIHGQDEAYIQGNPVATTGVLEITKEILKAEHEGYEWRLVPIERSKDEADEKLQLIGKIEVIEVTNLGTIYPTQWTGKTSDGRFVYVRYRYSFLTVTISAEPADNIKSCLQDDSIEIFSIKLREEGDDTFEMQGYRFGLGGDMTYERMKQLTQHKIMWPDNQILAKLEGNND